MQSFTKLHHQNKPLIIANVWDVKSAQIAQQLGFQALGTSSMAIAQNLGYEDGEQMSFEELVSLVKRITHCTQTPLTVDLEAGYSRNPQRIAEHIITIAKCGVVGINIEDSLVHNNKRTLRDLTEFTDCITQVLKILHDHEQAFVRDIFINIRTDTFLLIDANPLEKAIERLTAYNELGVNGVFVPGVTKISDIQAITAYVDIPVNVMCMPELPDFTTLRQCGVARISMGNFIHDKMHCYAKQILKTIVDTQSFTPVFNTNS